MGIGSQAALPDEKHQTSSEFEKRVHLRCEVSVSGQNHFHLVTFGHKECQDASGKLVVLAIGYNNGCHKSEL